ncbi:MAG: hypothetical protein HZB92_08820 [Euryarchaeota archaeon]|nr:hypothetical protein [Euryarchaeota archaeon]
MAAKVFLRRAWLVTASSLLCAPALAYLYFAAFLPTLCWPFQQAIHPLFPIFVAGLFGLFLGILTDCLEDAIYATFLSVALGAVFAVVIAISPISSPYLSNAIPGDLIGQALKAMIPVILASLLSVFIAAFLGNLAQEKWFPDEGEG